MGVMNVIKREFMTVIMAYQTGEAQTTGPWMQAGWCTLIGNMGGAQTCRGLEKNKITLQPSNC